VSERSVVFQSLSPIFAVYEWMSTVNNVSHRIAFQES
jgi:hypothetical protein